MILSPLRLRLSPFGDVRRMQRMLDQLAISTFGSSTVNPRIRVWNHEDAILIQAELPGMSQSDLEISVQANTITFSGKVPAQDRAGAVVKLQERAEGAFTRSLSLPFTIDSDLVEAKYEHGVLTIDVKRPESDKPHKVTIQVQ